MPASSTKIPYLKDLGITAVELMPIFQCDPQEGSCWGYMPLNFFAPHHGYSSRRDGCDQHNEFRAMVEALHEADIEVILDVVYNHTAEGDERGPIYSYKGIDNSTYYLMSSQSGNPYANFSGTGNTLVVPIHASASWSWTAPVIGSRRCTSTGFDSTWHPRWFATTTVH